MRTNANAKYPALGRLLTDVRLKAGLKQSEFAALVGAGQQTVSRWEHGTSRPRSGEIPRIGRALNIDPVELSAAAGYLRQDAATVSFDKPLPLYALAPESFERFCADFLERLYRSQKGEVHRAGGPGHTQDGVDVRARVAKKQYIFQCKRVAEFGPAKVRAAMGVKTPAATKKVLMLAATASPQARAEVDGSDWELWDQEDISRMVRGLSPQHQKELVDIFFPGQRFALLGIDEASPWQTSERFFAPFRRDRGAFGHSWSLIGRETELNALLHALQSDPVILTLLTGPGGSGKSRLLLEALKRYQKSNRSTLVRILEPHGSVSAEGLEGLGQESKLLVVDDAQDREDLALLFHYAADPHNKCRLLLSLRLYGIEKIGHQAATLSLLGREVTRIELGAWTKTNARLLAEQVLRRSGADVALAAPVADMTFDDPLLTVIGAYVVAKRQIHPQLIATTDEFARTVYGAYERAITQGIAVGQDVDRLQELLNIVALLQPISIDDQQLFGVFERVGQVPLAHSARLLKLLVDGGILFRRGNAYRISPDLLADFIIKRGCVTTSWTSTGYAERLFQEVPRAYVSHLLVNLGRLDWREQKGNTRASRLLGGLWGQLKWLDKYDNPYVEAAAEVAYYQPDQALAFAKRLIGEGYGDDAEVCKIIKYAGYNIEYVEEACALLWQLGRNDAEPLNRNPSHAFRILKELATPEPNKPVEYIEKVVDFALALARVPESCASVHSPFEILEEALASEGHTTRATVRHMSIAPYAVPADAMRTVRDKIIEALLHSIATQRDRRAFISAKTLASALREPTGQFGQQVGDEFRLPWRREILSTLKRVFELLGTTEISPVVRVRVAESVAWHAYHGPMENRAEASKIIAFLGTDLRTRCIRVLMDGWGINTWPIDTELMERTAFDRAAESLLGELSAAFPNAAELAQFLAECLREMYFFAGWGFGLDESSRFLVRLLSENVSFAREVADICLGPKEHPLASYRGIAIGTLLEKETVEGRRRIAELLSHEDSIALRTAAEAMSRFAPSSGYAPQDVEALTKIFESTMPQVLAYASHLSRVVAKVDVRLAVDLISRVNLTVTPQLADRFYGLLADKNVVPFESISDSHLEGLVGKLKQLPELDDYWVIAFLRKTIKRKPVLVVELLQSRLADIAMGSDWRQRRMGFHYREKGLGLLQTADGAQLLAGLLNWSLEHIDNELVAFALGEVIAALCAPFDETFTRIVEHWLEDGAVDHARVVAAALREAQTAFVLENEIFVRRILELAEDIDSEACRVVKGALFASAVTASGSTAPGEPFPHDVRLKAYAEKMLAKTSRIEPTYELFNQLLRHAEQGIASQAMTKERILAEEEEERRQQ